MRVSKVVEESGLTRALLAEDSGLHEQSLNSWIAGRRNPTPESMHQLADGLVKRARVLLDLAEQLKKWT